MISSLISKIYYLKDLFFWPNHNRNANIANVGHVNEEAPDNNAAENRQYARELLLDPQDKSRKLVLTCGINGPQLGQGMTHPINRCFNTPTKVETLLDLDIRQVSAGGSHTCVLTASGEIYSFGSVNHGQLGLGEMNPQKIWIPQKIRNFDDKSIIQISAGSNHTLALSEYGQVYGFGGNDWCQLGSEPLAIPFPTLITGFNGKFIKQVSAGGHHSIVVDDEGKVYGCGKNMDGQLGRPTNYRYNIDKVNSLDHVFVTQVSAGANHTIVLSDEKLVYSFGSGEYGQLGLGNWYACCQPTLIPGLEDVIKISAGAVHTTILTETGDVYTFGRGDNGRLGIENNGNTWVHTPQKIALSRIVQISSGSGHTIAVDELGQMFGFGRCEYGQLGLDVAEYYPTPTKLRSIPYSINIAQISAGTEHTVILTDPDYQPPRLCTNLRRDFLQTFRNQSEVSMFEHLTLQLANESDVCNNILIHRAVFDTRMNLL